MARRRKQRRPWWLTGLRILLTLAVAAVSLYFCAGAMEQVLYGSGATGGPALAPALDAALSQRFQMYINNRFSSALDGVLSIKKVYWLSDDDLTAPKPDPACYGTCDDPAQMAPIIEAAQELLAGQELFFSTDVQLRPKSTIRYYLDETIFAITWKEARDGAVYTFSEVKIAHPSQLRRFLSGGSYGSEIRQTATEMAQSVNAVVASSGDFYGFRRAGVVAYDGVVYRANRLSEIDSCFIDDRGELIFAYAGDLKSKAEAQTFVDDHNIRFSMAFGPVLVDQGKTVNCADYPLGEVDLFCTRSAIGQRDELHYILTVCNIEGGYYYLPTMRSFQKQVATLGCDRVYALDGGQTAVIAMDGELINAVHFGTQRDITDIFYFATAIPDGEK